MAVAVLLATLSAFEAASLRRTQGHLIYALDDAYIHMAMAKNLAKHGVWGITPDGFTSTSSSPLWTLLLAFIYALGGVSVSSPLILNVVFACLALFAAYGAQRTSRTPPEVTLVALVALILLTPLPTLVAGGMEHTLQTALVLAATLLAARVLSAGEPREDRGLYLGLLALAPPPHLGAV